MKFTHNTRIARKNVIAGIGSPKKRLRRRDALKHNKNAAFASKNTVKQSIAALFPARALCAQNFLCFIVSLLYYDRYD